MSTIPIPETPDFSLVLGGPLFQLYRRAHMAGAGLEFLLRRVLVITLFAWSPLLFLSMLEGHALGGAISIPFLYDIAAHCRFLVALPMLIVAEVVVHMRVGPLVRQFVERRIVRTEDLPRFTAAVNSVLRFRNSVGLELTLLIVAYTLGVWFWRSQVALRDATWYGLPAATHFQLTLAGYWLAFVSIPIFQFILLRWYLRLALWCGLLWQISRLKLHLTAAHPDRAGGIGFLGRSSYAFGPILFAQGALLAGLIANRILYEGQSLTSFKVEAGGLVSFFLLIVLGPLFMFTPILLRTKRAGAFEYGLLANRYVFGFEEKWIRNGVPEAKDIAGVDIQSLSDLIHSCSAVSQMGIVPFRLEDVTRLAAATVAPLLPLALTMFSPEEVLTRLIKIMV